MPKTMHVTVEWKFSRGWSDQHAACYLPESGEKGFTCINQFKQAGNANDQEWFRSSQNFSAIFQETAESVIVEIDQQRAQLTSDNFSCAWGILAVAPRVAFYFGIYVMCMIYPRTNVDVLFVLLCVF